MHDVRTTFQPDKTVQVDDAEYADLKRQGLLVEEDAADENTDGQGKSTQDKPPAEKTPTTGKAGDEK